MISFFVYWTILAVLYSKISVAASNSVSVCDNVYPHLSFGLSRRTQQPLTQNECENEGGCWDSKQSISEPANLYSCYFPKVYGYQLIECSNSPGKLVGRLSLLRASGALGSDYCSLQIDIIQETSTRIRIKIFPIDDKGDALNAWEIPQSVVPRNQTQVYSKKSDMSFRILDKSPFELAVIRGNDVIFFLSKMLIFQPQYVQVVLGSSKYVRATFGFGESTRSSQQMQYNTPYTLWNTDYWAAAKGSNNSLYGSHPFYIQLLENGLANGVLLMNSNAIEATLFQSDNESNAIGIQTTGGILDFYVFGGPSPSDVVAQYQKLVGYPYLVPYWSLGFHNCRWGYPSVEYVRQVVSNYSLAGIPLETQWVDIDYMNAYKDFTTDPNQFPISELQSFINDLHLNGQFFVPIVDPGIYAVPASSTDDVYSALVDGLNQNVFVYDLEGNTYLGQVWPGPTYFPDWFAVNASKYWFNQLSAFHKLVPYDGLWIDMNEASNFCNIDGSCQVCELDYHSTCEDGCCLNCKTVDPDNTYDFPPFTPHVSQSSLGAKTLSMSATHAGGIKEYNAHSLYGIMESQATYDALINVTYERPFVLSRSTFISSGRHSAHWTGDNAATFQDMADSIITMNNLALFGISMTGADICGFIDDTTEELCARWIEVGAFSPFTRNHNEYGAQPQELYRWNSVTRASINALSMKHQLLPHLYTLLYLASTAGITVMNAMWMHFPNDPVAVSRDGQYMWSDGLLFTPVLNEGVNFVTGYFPQGSWYPLFDSDTVGPIFSDTAGQYITLPTNLENTNAHVRGGVIVPMQGFGLTTRESKRTPFKLLVALNQLQHASGSLFLDDGVEISRQNYVIMKYYVESPPKLINMTFSSKLKSSVSISAGNGLQLPESSRLLGCITILGIRPNAVNAVGNNCQVLLTLLHRDSRPIIVSLTSITLHTQQFANAQRAEILKLVIDLTPHQLLIVNDFELEWTC